MVKTHIAACGVVETIPNNHHSHVSISIAAFPKLWVATQKWVAKLCQVGRQIVWKTLAEDPSQSDVIVARGILSLGPVAKRRDCR